MKADRFTAAEYGKKHAPAEIKDKGGWARRQLKAMVERGEARVLEKGVYSLVPRPKERPEFRESRQVRRRAERRAAKQAIRQGKLLSQHTRVRRKFPGGPAAVRTEADAERVQAIYDGAA